MAWRDPAGVEHLMPESASGHLDRLFRNLMEVQERKRRNAIQDQLLAAQEEERQRKIAADEEAQQLQQLKFAQAVAAQQHAPTKTAEVPVPAPLPANVQPSDLIEPEPSAAESASEIQTQAKQPVVKATTEDTTAPRPSFRLKLRGGEMDVPLQNYEEIERERNKQLLEKGIYGGEIVEGDEGRIMPASLAAAIARTSARESDPLAGVKGVSGGYLTIENGKPVFHRTAEDTGEKPGVKMPVVDNTGNIIGFYDNKTGEYSEAKLPPGARRTPVSAGEMTSRGSLQEIIADAEQLESLSKGKAGSVIGPVSGRVTGLTRGITGADQEVQDLFHISDNLADKLLRARSGAQINEQEYRRLRTLVPNPRDNRSKFDADLRRFLIESRNALSSRQGKGVMENSPEAPAPPAATGGATKWIVGPDGKLVRQ